MSNDIPGNKVRPPPGPSLHPAERPGTDKPPETTPSPSSTAVDSLTTASQSSSAPGLEPAPGIPQDALAAPPPRRSKSVQEPGIAALPMSVQVEALAEAYGKLAPQRQQAVSAALDDWLERFD